MNMNKFREREVFLLGKGNYYPLPERSQKNLKFWFLMRQLLALIWIPSVKFKMELKK